MVTKKKDYEKPIPINKEPEVELEAEVINPIKIGTVANCEIVNFREQPSMSAKVLSVLKKGGNLTVDISRSTSDFYYVILPSGVEGWIKKEFVEV